MIVKRRTWLYRLTGQAFAHLVSFKEPVTANKAREFLRSSVGDPLDLWGRDKSNAQPLPVRDR
jgi:hypothetical protein